MFVYSEYVGSPFCDWYCRSGVHELLLGSNDWGYRECKWVYWMSYIDFAGEYLGC